MNKLNKNYVDAEVLMNVTNLFGNVVKDELLNVTKSIARYNTLATLVTKEMSSKIIVDEETLINRDNVLRSTVKKIFAFNDLVKTLNSQLLVTKRIDRTNLTQCVDLLDSFWFALWDVADRKAK